MADLAGVLADLEAEGTAVDALVAGLPHTEWSRETPAPGWTIAHQIGHLAWTDEIAQLAACDPERFQARLADAAAEPYGYVDRAAEQAAERAPSELLTHWRAGRRRLLDALREVPEGRKLPWFGPPMSAMSMATARLMETWAHGLDIADALGVRPAATDRLRHIAHLGVRTRDFAYRVRGLEPPTEPFRVELSSPSGELWAWGPVDAPEQVAGPALAFCLLVTQRRNRADLAVVAVGAQAEQWLEIAQAFAGPPGAGRTPGQDSA
ncbi:MAG TPA: TIGR03084 family metal-binding protein [Jatrophihabitans sp.]|nr:TIGR03084 family metal-binding protein [Jatrophihabitans sp.]